MAKFKNQFPELKLEFGNELHLQIMDKMKTYYKLRAEVEKWMEERKPVVEKKKKSLALKNEIRKMIAFAKEYKKPA